MDEFWQWKGNAALGAGGIILAKGTAATIITATITATLTGDTTYTSSETNMEGFNSVLIEFTISSAGLTSILNINGAMSSGGTMVAIIDKDTSAQMTSSLSANQTIRFTGLPDYLGLSLTLSAGMTAGASATIKILPLNL